MPQSNPLTPELFFHYLEQYAAFYTLYQQAHEDPAFKQQQPKAYDQQLKAAFDIKFKTYQEFGAGYLSWLADYIHTHQLELTTFEHQDRLLKNLVAFYTHAKTLPPDEFKTYLQESSAKNAKAPFDYAYLCKLFGRAFCPFTGTLFDHGIGNLLKTLPFLIDQTPVLALPEKSLVLKDPAFKQMYEKTVDFFQKGTFSSYLFDDTIECQCCAKRLGLSFKNHVPLLEPKQTHTQNQTANLDCFANQTYTLSCFFPTGNLLITDGIHIEAFTKATGYNQDYNQPSINFAYGRFLSSQHSANQGFINVHVGNSCPTLYAHHDAFLFGHMHEEFDNLNQTTLHAEHLGFTDHGSVCTDLWNVCIIDEKTLHDILSHELGEPQAKKLIEEFLNERDVKRVKITPGLCHFSFQPHTEYTGSAHLQKDFDDTHPIHTMAQQIDTLFSVQLPKAPSLHFNRKPKL